MVLDSPVTITFWDGARSPLHGDQDLDSGQSDLSADFLINCKTQAHYLYKIIRMQILITVISLITCW